MKTFLRVAVSGTQEQREILVSSMVELGCRGFEETDTHLVAYFEQPDDPAARARLESSLGSLLRRISSNAEIRFDEIADRNWNAEWEESIRPIEIGERLVISPSWCGYTGTPERIVLTIDPKMSFGTGYHETTRLMLRLLEKHVRPGSFVLDVGTGTGVLAIAAVKLGAGSAIGTDTDEWAVNNAEENIRLNGCGGAIGIHHGSLPDDLPSRPSLLCANLTCNDIVRLLPRFREILPGGGILLLSGLLSSDEPAISAALGAEDFRTVEILRENEWMAIRAE